MISKPGKIQNKDEIMTNAGVVGCEDFGEWIEKGNQSKFCDHFLRAIVGHRRFDCGKK